MSTWIRFFWGGSLPGRRRVIKFHTSFANKAEAIETVTLAREGSDWRVVGYWIS